MPFELIPTNHRTVFAQTRFDAESSLRRAAEDANLPVLPEKSPMGEIAAEANRWLKKSLAHLLTL